MGESAEHGRRAPRDSMFLAAELICPNKPPKPVRVRNISAGGLLAEGLTPCRVGDAVTLSLRGVGMVAGRAIWVEDDRVGVAFDQPIDPRRTRKPVGQGKSNWQAPIIVRRSGLRTN